ncbi:MAG: hypothetical protein U0R68_08080 [Candidatus Nanopelagicales bacterium]
MSRTSRRMVGVGITLVATVGLAVAASGVTSAYFSDINSGTVTGSIGWVKIQTDGGTGDDGLDLNFTDLMPGEPQTVKFNYRNTGSGVQDLWLTFPNVPALHALNNLGHYGYLKITDSSAGVRFESSNLQDGRTKADGTNSCGIYPAGFGPGLCNPLPSTLKVRDNLAVGASGTVTITFSYSADLGDANPGTNGGPFPWNSYPANLYGGQAYGPDAALPAGNGLPYNVVATQAGQTP